MSISLSPTMPEDRDLTMDFNQHFAQSLIKLECKRDALPYVESDFNRYQRLVNQLFLWGEEWDEIQKEAGTPNNGIDWNILMRTEFDKEDDEPEPSLIGQMVSDRITQSIDKAWKSLWSKKEDT